MINAANNGEAVALVLSEILRKGHDVSLAGTKSIGAGRTFRELVNLQATVADPALNLVHPIFRKFRLTNAVARLAWMLAASNRVEDIAYYDPGVRRFSDDGVIVPGSDFGRRILAPYPGVNQLHEVIRLLKEDRHTRRAVIAVYQPGDCGRDSRDIPCALNVAFHVRDSVLYPTVVMRSNNAWALLPYNLFEFSVIAEVVACEIGLPLGALTHIALSMHVYEEDLNAAAETVAQSSSAPVLAWSPGAMREAGSPLPQIETLCQFESSIRKAGAAADIVEMKRLLAQCETTLTPYWRSFVLVLFWFSGSRMGNTELQNAALERLAAPWRELLIAPT